MHITPLILSVWSFKNHLDWAYLETAPRLAFDEDARPNGQLISSMIGSEISADDYHSIRKRESADLEQRHVTDTNEIAGSPFKSNEIVHNGTEAWDSLKARLAENDIFIDDQQVAELAAGFQAQRKLQDILCHADPLELKAELDLKWVQDIENRADREQIAQECLTDLKQNYPRAIACDVYEKAIGFDPLTVDTTCDR